jgi:hypothetical protein
VFLRQKVDTFTVFKAYSQAILAKTGINGLKSSKIAAGTPFVKDVQ